MTRESEPVRWGILSTADIGLKKVIPGMRRSDAVDVVAIGSREADRAADAARRLGIPRSFGSYEDLLADADVEAVYIPLPNHLHHDWTIAAAEAGKHVLCEKPIALTATEANEMAVACERAGVMLMEAFMYRLHPLWVTVKGLLDEGAIGELHHVQSAFTYFNDDPDDIRNIPEAGGGALYDIGCYPINVARLVFESEPTVVQAVMARHARFGTDAMTTAILEFEGGHASMMCSTTLEPAQRVDLYGSEGRLVIEIPFNIPPDLPTRILQIAGGTPPVSPDVIVHEVPSADPYTVQAEAFSRAIRGEIELPFPASDAVANMQVIEAIIAAAG